MQQSVSGVRPVKGTSLTAGHRDFEIELHRGFTGNPIEISELFNGISQTFDLTEAVEFTTVDDPNTVQKLRSGDVITMWVVINT